MKTVRRTIPLILALSLLAGCEKGPDNDSAMEAPSAEIALNDQQAAETVYCPEVEQRIPRANCEDLTETATRTREGVAAFNAPPMERGKTTRIQLAIGNAPKPVPTPEAMAPDNMTAENASEMAEPDNATATAPPPSPTPTPERGPASLTPEETVENQPGETQSYRPIVGRHMRAELTGTGFKIEPRSPLSQTLAPDSVITWEWDVTPQKSATYALTIKTAVEGVTGDNKRYPLRSTVRNKAVEVTIPWYYQALDFIDAAPLWLKSIATLLGSLAAVATAWWVLRRAVAGKSGSDGEKPGPDGKPK